MRDNFDGRGERVRAVAANALEISRRRFLGSAFAASTLLVAGLPLEAATRDRVLTGRHVGEDLTDRIVNVQVSHDGPRHTEPCLAVNPRNPHNLLAVSMSVLATYVSFDGGRTWRSGGPLRLPPDSGGGNVSAAFDSTGHGFVCGLFGTPAGQNSVLVWRTGDGGRTFTRSAVVGQGANLDRPWLATDRHRPGVVHVVWSEGASAGIAAGRQTDLRYSRSTDAAQTFDAPRTIARNAAGLGNPMVACGPPGNVYILYSGGSGAAGNAAPDAPSTVTVVCSHDGGHTFRPPIVLGQSTDLLSFPGLNGATGTALPAIAAHPNNGLICAAFTDHAAGASGAGALLAASRDGGRNWSRATAVTPQDQVIYFQPEVAIDDSGRIGVMAFAMNQGMVNVVLMISEPRSLRFGPPITVTDQPFNPVKVNYRLGDYQALAVAPGAFHPLWNDTRTGRLELFTAAVGVGR